MDSLQAVQQAWQIANGDYIDVPTFGAPDDGDSLVWDAGSGAFVKATLATSAALAAHIADAANPHGVTAAQVGSYTIANADSAIAAAVSTHAAAADPHTPYLLVAGTRASTGTQTFSAGIVSPYAAPASDGPVAWQVRKADKTTAIFTVDTTTPGAQLSGPLVLYDNTTDDTQKSAALTMYPYSTERKKILIFYGRAVSDNTTQALFGGGTGAYDAASQVLFYTGDTAQSGAGTVRMVINNQTITASLKHVLVASTTAAASINIPSGTAPTSPNDGDMWFDGTNLKIRIGGVTKTFTVT